MEKLVFSIPEAAEVLGIGKSLCYRLAKSEELPAIKLGSRYVIPKQALERFISMDNRITTVR